MNIIEKLLGRGYPKLGSEVFADGNKTVVTVSRTLSPDHVDLDAPSYVETKFKKHIPILRSINVIKAIGLDCKPFICTDDESEEAQANA